MQVRCGAVGIYAEGLVVDCRSLFWILLKIS
jgi:hypothetical protein